MLSLALVANPTNPTNKMETQEIRKALQVPFDLLAQMPITYHQKTKNPDRWKEEANYEVKSIQIKGLIVEKRKNTETNETLQGSRTNNEGYLLISYDYAKQAGLVDNYGNFLGNPNTDTFTYQNKTYKILDVEPVGQLVDTFTAFKIWYKT
ncbi:MAG: hypothetical protein OHK0045_22800 [Raineya sp.]